MSKWRGKDVVVKFKKDLPPQDVVSQSGHFKFVGVVGSIIELSEPPHHSDTILVSPSVIVSIKKA